MKRETTKILCEMCSNPGWAPIGKSAPYFMACGVHRSVVYRRIGRAEAYTLSRREIRARMGFVKP